ncbi:MAG TPA: DUF3553 domain-containing protein [Rhodocyclaceae bacterium]|nr:DUF3553 domain-containing protein [Rhodocyclaceae bacterium]
MSPVTQGDRVFHPTLKDWGLGKVLRVTPDHVDVFFVGVGSKRLAKSFVKLEIAEGMAAKHPLLDNLMEASQIADASYLTLPAAIERFLAAYPDGLEGKDFLKEEREPTQRGNQFFNQLLGQEELSRLISEGNHRDVCDRARHVESVTTLLTKTEKNALYAALDLPENQKVFSEGLADYLYGTDPEDERFSRFVRTLHLIELAKWPFVTLFGFIRFPQERVFIKPTATQNAAKTFCWRINYKPEPNWKTYSSVVRFYNHIRTGLVEEGMMPRDLIDVQAFIWSACQK